MMQVILKFNFINVQDHGISGDLAGVVSVEDGVESKRVVVVYLNLPIVPRGSVVYVVGLTGLMVLDAAPPRVQ